MTTSKMENECKCKACAYYMKNPMSYNIDNRMVLITKCAINSFISIIVNEPVSWKSKTYESKLYTDKFHSLFISFGKYSYEFLECMTEWISHHVPAILDNKLKNLDFKDEKINNFEFLALVGKQRNWRDGCTICLTDEPTGTICLCGQTTTMVFRPCGHSMCVDPCFTDFVSKKGFEFDKYNETEFVNKFKCPNCRNDVTKAFFAEKMDLKKYEFMSDAEITKLLQLWCKP